MTSTTAAASTSTDNLIRKQNVLFLGDVAPDFKAETSEGPISFHEWLGDNWGILFSHPFDYTPVCTTELGRVAKLQEEFKARNVKTIALSCDTTEHHSGWIADINETQNTTVNYPIIADPDRKIALLYGMLDQNLADQKGIPVTVRSVFVIGPDKKIKLTLTYPASTGRNFDEILRVIDSLQMTAYHKCATPADWRKGDDAVILPNVTDTEAETLFPKGFKKIKPYLRLTPDPSATSSS